MKVFMIMAIIASMAQPIPMETAKDNLDLNTVTNWETDMEDNTMVLTLYTDAGDMYVLEKEVNQ